MKLKLKKSDFVGMEGRIIHMWADRYSDDVHVISTWTFGGARLADIRTWYPKSDGKYYPGKGFRIRKADIAKVAKGISALQDFLSEDESLISKGPSRSRGRKSARQPRTIQY